MQEPITDDEYAWMHYLRRSVDYPAEGTPELDRWVDIYRRFYAQHTHSLERNAWHEAAHVVVAHRLGGRVDSVTRDADGAITNIAVFELRHVEFLLWAATMVAGYLVEARAVGRVDPNEAGDVGVAFQERWYERNRALPPPAEVLNAVTIAETVATAIINAYWDAVERVAHELMNEPWPLERARLTELLADVPYGDLLVMDGELGDALQFAMARYQVGHEQAGPRAVLAERGTYQAAEVAAQEALIALQVQGAEGSVVVRHRDHLLYPLSSERI